MKLLDATDKLRFPRQIKRALRYIYNDYINLLSDPFLFDTVLDLWDPFKTLYKTITELESHNVVECQALGSDNRLHPILDNYRTTQLADFIDALHNALVHRVSNASKDRPNRDIAGTFKGSLNQILMATGVPLACGIGIFRKYMEHDSEDTWLRDQAGGVIRIGFKPGIYSNILNLSTNDTQLAYFDASVAHILHIASWTDYIHEAFHFIFRHDLLKTYNIFDSHLIVRVEEIFATLSFELFIFGKDIKAFRYHLFLSYSRAPESIGPQERYSKMKFVEVATRIFLTSYAIEKCYEKPLSEMVDFPLKVYHIERDLYCDFEKMLLNCGHMFSEFDRWWKDEKFKQFTKAQFCDICKSVLPYMADTWKHAIGIYNKVYKETFPNVEANNYVQLGDDLGSLIEHGFKKGSPLIWSRYQGPGAMPLNTPIFENINGMKYYLYNTPGGMDTLQFSMRILYQYIQTIRRAIATQNGNKKLIHLRRDKNGKVEYTKGNWHEFQADKGRAFLNCCIPHCRRERVKKQITIIKSFWDISSELRARRLLELFPRD